MKVSFNKQWAKSHSEAEFVAMHLHHGSEDELKSEYAKLIAESAPSPEPEAEKVASPKKAAVKNVPAAQADKQD